MAITDQNEYRNPHFVTGNMAVHVVMFISEFQRGTPLFRARKILKCLLILLQQQYNQE